MTAKDTYEARSQIWLSKTPFFAIQCKKCPGDAWRRVFNSASERQGDALEGYVGFSVTLHGVFVLSLIHACLKPRFENQTLETLLSRPLIPFSFNSKC